MRKLIATLLIGTSLSVIAGTSFAGNDDYITKTYDVKNNLYVNVSIWADIPTNEYTSQCFIHGEFLGRTLPTPVVHTNFEHSMLIINWRNSEVCKKSVDMLKEQIVFKYYDEEAKKSLPANVKVNGTDITLERNTVS